jgi:hypothetical protein
VAYINRGSAQTDARGARLLVILVAIRLEPELKEAKYNRGTMLAIMRRFGSAIADFYRGDQIKTWFSVGLLQLRLGERRTRSL